MRMNLTPRSLFLFEISLALWDWCKRHWKCARVLKSNVRLTSHKGSIKDVGIWRGQRVISVAAGRRARAWTALFLTRGSSVVGMCWWIVPKTYHEAPPRVSQHVPTNPYNAQSGLASVDLEADRQIILLKSIGDTCLSLTEGQQMLWGSSIAIQKTGMLAWFGCVPSMHIYQPVLLCLCQQLHQHPFLNSAWRDIVIWAVFLPSIAVGAMKPLHNNWKALCWHLVDPWS